MTDLLQNQSLSKYALPEESGMGRRSFLPPVKVKEAGVEFVDRRVGRGFLAFLVLAAGLSACDRFTPESDPGIAWWQTGSTDPYYRQFDPKNRENPAWYQQPPEGTIVTDPDSVDGLTWKPTLQNNVFGPFCEVVRPGDTALDIALKLFKANNGEESGQSFENMYMGVEKDGKTEIISVANASRGGTSADKLQPGGEVCIAGEPQELIQKELTQNPGQE